MAEKIEIVPLYFAAERPTYEWEGGSGSWPTMIERLRFEDVLGKQARNHDEIGTLPHTGLLPADRVRSKAPHRRSS